MTKSVVLAAPRGYCAGVDRAVTTVELALQRFGAPIYVRKQIVHNRHVVEELEKQGAVFVDELDAVPSGATVVFSAHGVSPAVHADAAARGLKTIDATCPLVTRVHNEAKKFAAQGVDIVLIGHAGHEEVVGTMGEAPRAIRLVACAEEVDRLEVPDPDKVAYLTQTTLSVDDTALIVARLRQRFPKLAGPARDDICYATQHRQEAVQRLASGANVVLVVGSRNSSNSQRLAELARAGGEAHLIDGPADIDPAWFRGDETVLLTAGASAPEHLVEGCVRLLKERFGGTVETVAVCHEEVHFGLPLELRSSASRPSRPGSAQTS